MRTVDDRVDNGPDRTVEITHTATVGGDVDIALESLTVTVTDDDTRGIQLSRGNFALSENLGLSGYQVRLTSQPTHPVEVRVVSGTPTAVAVGNVGVADSGLVNFTTANWGDYQELVAVGQDDSVNQGPGADRTSVVTHTASGAITKV